MHYKRDFLKSCKTSNRRTTKNSRIFEIAKQLVHELISAANNSCNQTINVVNISGRAISSALYIYCIAQLILAFVQCKHNFLGFTILWIHDYDPELETPDAHVICIICVITLLFVNVVMLHVFLAFGLCRAHPGPYIFHSKCQGKNVHARVFPRCRPKLHYFFSRICPKMHQFFRDVFKKFA